MREMRKREKKLIRKYATAAASKAFWRGWSKGVSDGAAKERELIVRALLEKTSLSEREVAEIVGMSTFSVQYIKNEYPVRGGQQ
jgi:DNA-binding ferritin-like protein (Dps family)